jgi:hypothetical protein
MADFVNTFAEEQKADEVLRMQDEDKQNERMFLLLAQALGPQRKRKRLCDHLEPGLAAGGRVARA